MSDNKKGRPKGSGRDNGFKLSKMTNAEVEDFLVQSTELIFTKHLSYKEYIEWCRQQDISVKQANEYWVRVWQSVKEKFKLKKDELITKHLKAYWDIHSRALTNNDLSNARQVLNDIAKLTGINEPERLDIKGESTIIFKFGDE
jgi:hypothetical protein